MEDCRAKSQGIGVEAEVADVAELDVEQGWYPDFDARLVKKVV